MPFSNTVGQTVFDTRKVIESAARRCKIRPQLLTSDHVGIAKDELFLLLSSLSSKVVPLWCIDKSIYPLYEGVNRVFTYLGTVDVLNANLRYLQEVTGTNTTTSTQQSTEFETPTVVSTVGIKWSTTSVDLIFERSDDGVFWTQVDALSPEAVAGEWTWHDLPSAVAAQYFRVRGTSGNLGTERIYLSNTPTEIPMARLNRDDYTNLPNKQFTSNRPLQYWLDRQTESPVMRLWPSPNAAAETSQLVVWARRQIMDVGTMTQEIELPQRWYDAVVAELAYRLAMEFEEVDPNMIPLLKGIRDEALYYATQEERDNSPIKILPNIAPYTR